MQDAEFRLVTPPRLLDWGAVFRWAVYVGLCATVAYLTPNPGLRAALVVCAGAFGPLDRFARFILEKVSEEEADWLRGRMLPHRPRWLRLGR